MKNSPGMEEMLELCRHKSAAASINWMVNLLKGKASGEQVNAIKALETMFDDMVSHNCAKCRQMNGCRELDGARRILAEAPLAAPVPVIPPRTPGALMFRGVPRRTRTGRAADRT